MPRFHRFQLVRYGEHSGFPSSYAIKCPESSRRIQCRVQSSCEAINVDLAGKIVYDDSSVFRRLRVNEVDDDLVATCESTLNFLYESDISLLRELAEQASRKSPNALEVEEVGDKRSDNNGEEKSGNHGSVEEKKMYDPLVRNILHDFFPF